MVSWKVNNKGYGDFGYVMDFSFGASTLSEVVCACKTYHKRTRIEDFVVHAGEPSPLVGRFVPDQMIVKDSSMWFSQTIPPLYCFPRYMMCTIICTSPWILILGKNGHGYLDTWKWILGYDQNPGTLDGVFRRPLVG
ncbi:unnamed protein product [Prunus armeniaca]